MADAVLMMGQHLTEWVPGCAGLTKALRPPSESCVSVCATMLPPIEVTWMRGNLFVNFMYVLVTEAGEVHPPKDSERREIALTTVLMSAVRQQVLQDVLSLSARHTPLAAGFWRQLGNHAMEAQVVAGGAAALPRPPRERKTPPTPRYEIETILETERGRGGCFVKVRWSGYDPSCSWEAWRISGAVGSPLETWEPLRLVCRGDR